MQRFIKNFVQRKIKLLGFHWQIYLEILEPNDDYLRLAHEIVLEV